jgi:hypothetical protein
MIPTTFTQTTSRSWLPLFFEKAIMASICWRKQTLRDPSMQRAGNANLLGRGLRQRGCYTWRAWRWNSNGNGFGAGDGGGEEASCAKHRWRPHLTLACFRSYCPRLSSKQTGTLTLATIIPVCRMLPTNDSGISLDMVNKYSVPPNQNQPARVNNASGSGSPPTVKQPMTPRMVSSYLSRSSTYVTRCLGGRTLINNRLRSRTGRVQHLVLVPNFHFRERREAAFG